MSSMPATSEGSTGAASHLTDRDGRLPPMNDASPMASNRELARGGSASSRSAHYALQRSGSGSSRVLPMRDDGSESPVSPKRGAGGSVSSRERDGSALKPVRGGKALSTVVDVSSAGAEGVMLESASVLFIFRLRVCPVVVAILTVAALVPPVLTLALPLETVMVECGEGVARDDARPVGEACVDYGSLDEGDGITREWFISTTAGGVTWCGARGPAPGVPMPWGDATSEERIHVFRQSLGTFLADDDVFAASAAAARGLMAVTIFGLLIAVLLLAARLTMCLDVGPRSCACVRFRINERIDGHGTSMSYAALAGRHGAVVNGVAAAIFVIGIVAVAAGATSAAEWEAHFVGAGVPCVARRASAAGAGVALGLGINLACAAAVLCAALVATPSAKTTLPAAGAESPQSAAADSALSPPQARRGGERR